MFAAIFISLVIGLVVGFFIGRKNGSKVTDAEVSTAKTEASALVDDATKKL
jgi:uncharacterized membrane-anchored protein YhcB (DUF1043 family)